MLFVSAACLLASAGVVCGSRTGLLVPVNEDAGGVDATTDAVEEPGFDAADDVADAVSEPDVFDAFVPPDGPDICPDAGSTLVYLITSQNVLVAFYPPTNSFTSIGTINCPINDPTDSPFSMAVDRQGTAYVVFAPSGNLFRVSTKTAACAATSYVPGRNGFPTSFGMAFSADSADGGSEAGETLYLAADPGGVTAMNPSVLGTLDVQTFRTRAIATIRPTILASELTGTGGGGLYGFYPQFGTSGVAEIGRIDKATASVVQSTLLPAINIQAGWAFAFYGGVFYTFTGPDGVNTTVQRYDPATGTVLTVAMLPNLIVTGAGVSTCAPQQ